jgi:hypothetical protein
MSNQPTRSVWVNFAAWNRFAIGVAILSIGCFAAGQTPSALAFDALSLDGPWSVVPDRDDAGLKQEWWKSASYPQPQAKPIPVPGNTYEALPDYNGIAWYLRGFNLDRVPVTSRRSFLRFGAVQYRCEVWLNGQELGNHEGGEGGFEFEVTGKLVKGPNALILRVENPVGIFKEGKMPIFYNQGGIIGHVDLLEQPKMRIAEVYAKPDPATGAIVVEVACDNAGAPTRVELLATVTERASLREKNRVATSVDVPSGPSVQHLALRVESPHRWDLDDPFLYSVEVRATANGDRETNHVERLGFRDFRVVDGFFHLNGRRIFLKSLHNNHYDPVLEQGVSRDMTWMGGDAVRLKAAGFNMLRSAASALLPEQLAIADEVGLLIYNEHAGSWLLRDSSKFLMEFPNLIRRDRHHPSLVMWGLLNEIDSRSPGVYEVARDSLPAIRQIDDTRLFLLSSGRWDRDFANGSASNPGSTKWDVLLGGEGLKPMLTGALPDLPTAGPAIPDGGYIDGAGDIHVYNMHPTSWRFVNAFRTMAAATRPVFVSEAGCGSAFDPYTEQLRLFQAKASPTAIAWGRITPLIEGLEKTWKLYGLSDAYPDIPAMIADSQRAAAHERDLCFRALRSNPQFNGYSLTSMTDWFGLAEGIWDNFRGWKSGHEKVVTEGWAHTRFCLLVNPTPVAVNQPFRLVAALTDEDRLAAGAHRATLRVLDSTGTVRWKKICEFALGEPGKRPLAVVLLDEDLPPLSLSEGYATVEASLDGRAEMPGGSVQVPVYDANRHPRIEGVVQVIGIDATVRTLLSGRGAMLQEFDPLSDADHPVILCGADLPKDWNARNWRSVYKQVARGAHLLVVGPDVLHGRSGPTHFLPLEQHGKFEAKLDPVVYHREVVAKPGLVFEGLPAQLLTGEIYGRLLRGVGQIAEATPPERTIAVAFNASGMGALNPGLVIATWKFGAGQVTVCTMDLLARPGSPVPDRLLINLVRYARANTAALQPLPADYAAQLDKLGIIE